jgi:hypothetical protein
MKTKILFLGLVMSILIVSCSKNDTNKSEITTEEMTASAKMDIANDDISKIAEDQLTVNDGFTNKSTQSAYYLPSCAVVTRVPAYAAGTPTVGTLITKTIDFGTTGCPMPNGNVLKGKIVITFTYEPMAVSHTVNYSFVNFFHNAIQITGNKSFTRIMTLGTVASPSHPIVTMLMDMTATFPNGNSYNRVGTRTREIIGGYNTPLDWSDNVYQVTGNWTTTFPSALVQSSTISSPLIVKLNCNHIVQGIITITRNGNTATLDYGNGDCDNLAIFTMNGVSHNIVLGI